MNRWPCRFALVAVVLQCMGCTAQVVDDKNPSEMRMAPDSWQDQRGEGVATRPGNEPSSVPAMPLTLADAIPYLPTEFTFVEQDGLSGDKSDEVLESQMIFLKTLEKMRGEEKTSMEAQDLARHHRDVLERAVGEQGVVDELTCGLSLCMGAVTSPTQADHDTWNSRLVKDPAARRYGAVHRYEPVGDQLQNRFVFSADPAVGSLFMSR